MIGRHLGEGKTSLPFLERVGVNRKLFVGPVWGESPAASMG